MNRRYLILFFMVLAWSGSTSADAYDSPEMIDKMANCMGLFATDINRSATSSEAKERRNKATNFCKERVDHYRRMKALDDEIKRINLGTEAGMLTFRGDAGFGIIYGIHENKKKKAKK